MLACSYRVSDHRSFAFGFLDAVFMMLVPQAAGLEVERDLQSS